MASNHDPQPISREEFGGRLGTRQPKRDTWDSASGVPFGEWLRGGRTPSGMDAHEQELAHGVEARFTQLNAGADTALDAYLHGKTPRKAE